MGLGRTCLPYAADQLWAKIALNWCDETVRRRGRPRRRWRDELDGSARTEKKTRGFVRGGKNGGRPLPRSGTEQVRKKIKNN